MTDDIDYLFANPHPERVPAEWFTWLAAQKVREDDD